jgi:hypothetical protein
MVWMIFPLRGTKGTWVRLGWWWFLGDWCSEGEMKGAPVGKGAQRYFEGLGG